MAIFAPVYRPRTIQQSFLTQRRHLRSKKRKRDHDLSSADESDEGRVAAQSTPRTRSTAFHPVNKTDPYLVAGLSREDQIPPPPFPHAPVNGPVKSRKPTDEELANLNPPLYVHRRETGTTSFKHRHLDNLTTILHQCILKGDWQRAFRTWALLIRTEVDGRGIDVRRHDRWGIGAELLIRQSSVDGELPPPGSSDSGNTDASSAPRREASFSEEGFKQAREYYERLILQYPHTARTQHRSLNDTAFYPALFNIWIFEVQDRSKRAQRKLKSGSRTGQDVDEEGSSLMDADTTTLREIRETELQQALPISRRLNELTLGPPYDTIPDLVQMEGMVALWIADLCNMLEDDQDNEPDLTNTDQRVREQRQRAQRAFDRLAQMGIELPIEVSRIMAREEET